MTYVCVIYLSNYIDGYEIVSHLTSLYYYYTVRQGLSTYDYIVNKRKAIETAPRVLAPHPQGCCKTVNNRGVFWYIYICVCVCVCVCVCGTRLCILI